MDNNKFVLSCIDGSTFSQAVCDYAAWIAHSMNAPLKFLHNIEQHAMPPVSELTGTIGLSSSAELLDELIAIERERTRLLIKKGNIMLQAAKKRADKIGVKSVKLRQRHGSLTEAMVDMEQRIHMLVVGIRGEQHEDSQAGIGTQLEAIIRALHKPILVVNRTFSLPEKIMLAYDGSDAANKALRMVALSPLFKSIPCHLVRVVTKLTRHDASLDEVASQLTTAGVTVTAATIHGKIDEALATYQAEQNIDLTLMGAFSHNRVRNFLLGSFTAKMLERTQRPLLLLR